MMHMLTANNALIKDIALLVLRVGIGLIFIKHGWGKLIEGKQTWQWLGSNLAILGITWYPILWGFLAACSEFFGGILLTVGLYSRFAALLMSCVMFVAFVMHVQKGDSFGVYSHPLSLLVVFISIMISGSGRFSLDWLIH